MEAFEEVFIHSYVVKRMGGLRREHIMGLWPVWQVWRFYPGCLMQDDARGLAASPEHFLGGAGTCDKERTAQQQSSSDGSPPSSSRSRHPIKFQRPLSGGHWL